MHIRIFSAVLLVLNVWPAPMQGQDAGASNTSDGFNWSSAARGWSGARARLENQGIKFALNYTGDFLSNRSGGLSQNSALAYGFYGSTTFDFEKLVGAPGLSLYIAGAYQSGRDLSNESIGNVFDVAQVFGGNAGRLAQVYLLKSFAQGKYELAFGRLAAGDDFATIDSFAYYVNSAVNDNPATIGTNFPSFTVAPFAAWGVRFTANPNDNLYWSVGAYNADPGVQDDDKHGLDFDFNPQDGVVALAEIGISRNQDKYATSLPGRFVLGAIFDSSDYPSLVDPSVMHSGNYGFYAIAEQMLYREGGPGSDQGLTAWASVTSMPNDSINSLPVGLFAGANYKGLFNDRDDDVTGFAVYYGSFSEDLPGQNDEVVVELNHRFQISPSTYITPDLQYVINPNGGGNPNAFVVGFEASVNF